MSFSPIFTQIGESVTTTKAYLDAKAQAILAPRDAKGIGGFVFDIPTRESIELRTDITDHFTESGSYINDHAVDQPVKITVSGFIGELFIGAPEGLEGLTGELSNKLTALTGFTGAYTPQALRTLQNAVTKADQAIQNINNSIQRGKNFLDFLEGAESVFLKRQKEAFTTLDALRRSRSILAVTVPWAYYPSMMIESISVSQGEDTQFWSDFTVVLKEVRFAELRIVRFDENLFPPRSDIQSGEEQDQGVNRGESNDSSFLYQTFFRGSQ